jgi:hypothetical protein
LPLAIDNGAFSSYLKGCGFNEYGFLKMLSQIIDKGLKYEILVTPDIVAGGKKSAYFSLDWSKRLAGWKNQYFAVQDGMDVESCWTFIISGGFAGIFVGGTPEWKWKTAKDWVNFAHEKGLKCHIGQCGTLDKLLHADEIGADSVDSTNFTRNDNWKAIEMYHKMKGLNLFSEVNPK